MSDAIAIALREIKKEKRDGWLCGSQGCIPAKTRSKSVKKYYTTPNNARLENDHNALLIRRVDRALLDRYTMLVKGSVKRTRDLCKTNVERVASNREILDGLRSRSTNHEKTFVDENGNMCTLQYRLATSDVDRMLRRVKGGDVHSGVGKLLCEMLLEIDATLFQAMHAAGLYHMDIKPENLVLMDVGGARPIEMRVIDFGLMLDFASRKEYAYFPRRGTHITMSPAGNLSAFLVAEKRPWSSITPDDVEKALRHYWGGVHGSGRSKFGLVADMWGDREDYKRMVAEACGGMDEHLKDMDAVRGLLLNCDDYGVVMTCVDVFPGVGKTELRQALRAKLEMRPRRRGTRP
jgi:serine/threonine protein kinase